MKKLTLSLVTASRKLRSYFQAYFIEVLTNFSLKQVLQKTDASSRLLKWAIELSEFDPLFKPRSAIKGQALAYFVAEFAETPEMEATMGLSEFNLLFKPQSAIKGQALADFVAEFAKAPDFVPFCGRFIRRNGL